MELFADITASQQKGVIIHHWDTDGMVSAALLLNYFAEHYPEKKLELFVPTITNYYITDEQYEYFEQQGYDFALTCDINFQADTVERLAATFPGQVYMFDHHHQDPYTNVHYYNEPHPACASYINDVLGYPNNLQSVIAIVGDLEEAVQEDPEFYPRVQEMMAKYNITFSQLLQMRSLIDSNYVADDYKGISETVELLRHDPIAILTDVGLQENLTNIQNALAELSEQKPVVLSDHVHYFEIESSYNIISQATRNLSRRYPDKLIFTRHFMNDQYTCYVRRRDVDYDMREMIAFARDLGLNAGGKEDVVGIIMSKQQVDEMFEKVKIKLQSISL